MIPDEEPPEAPGSVFGHNSGSMRESAIAAQREAWSDTIRDGGKTFEQRASEFVTSAGRQVVRDRRSAADAADTIKLAGEVWTMVDIDRKARSDPYRETHLALSSLASEAWAPVADAMFALRQKIDAWTSAEDDRIAAQQREQEEQEAQMRAASAAPPMTVAENALPDATPIAEQRAPSPREHVDYTTGSAPARADVPTMRPARRARIIGDLGSIISPKDNTTYEIEDFALLPDHILRSPTVVEAILTVVRSTARHMGVPPGIRTVVTKANHLR